MQELLNDLTPVVVEFLTSPAFALPIIAYLVTLIPGPLGEFFRAAALALLEQARASAEATAQRQAEIAVRAQEQQGGTGPTKKRLALTTLELMGMDRLEADQRIEAAVLGLPE